MSRRRWTAALRRGMPGVVVGIGLAWGLGAGQAPPRSAQAGPNPTTGTADGTIAFSSAGAGNTQLLYLIDTRAQTLAVYGVDPTVTNAKGALKLVAARQYRFDLKLSEFNNAPPEVTAIESMVSGVRR